MTTEQIKELHSYQSGEVMSARGVARSLKIGSGEASVALQTMFRQGLLHYDEKSKRYWRAERGHWIHRGRLAGENLVKCSEVAA